MKTVYYVLFVAKRRRCFMYDVVLVGLNWVDSLIDKLVVCVVIK